jgi:hypothetical protein
MPENLDLSDQARKVGVDEAIKALKEYAENSKANK